MGVSIVARGAQAESRLRAKGVEPGKVSSYVSRKRTGKTTEYYTPTGELAKTEEKVAGGTKVTTYEKVPVASTPGTGTSSTMPETQDFYNAQGQKLTPYEAYYVQNMAGAASTAKPYTFGTQGTTTYYPAPTRGESTLKSTNIGFISNALDIQQGAKNELKLQEINKGISDSIASGDRGKLLLLQEERAELLKERYKKSEPKFGKYEPLKEGEELTLKRYGQQAAGVFSKGFETFGMGAEMRLQDERERTELALKWDATSTFQEKRLERKTDLIDLGQGIVSGGVTNLGKSKLAFGAFVGAGVLGGVVGTVKGALGGSKLLFTPGAAKALSFAGKGIRTGLAVGGSAIVVGTIATSEKPYKAIGEFGGTTLALATSYRAGKGIGTEIGRGVSEIEIPSIHGKKAAVYRGNRRISPTSKAQLRKQNYGYQSRTQKGIKYSQDKGENIAKIRDKATRKYVEQQLGGAKVKEIRIKYDSATLKNQRVEVYGARQYKAPTEKVKVMKPGFRKPVQVTKPIYPSSSDKVVTSSVSGGNQKLLTLKQVKQLNSVGRYNVQAQRTITINEQKVLPPSSKYSAVNIRKDVIIDVSTQQNIPPPSQGRTLAGGFRSETLKTNIYGRIAEQKALYDAKVLTSQLAGAQGILPGAKAGIQYASVVGGKTFVPLIFTSPEEKTSTTYKQNVELGTDTSQAYYKAQAYEPKIAYVQEEATAKEEITSPISYTPSGGGRVKPIPYIQPEPEPTPPYTPPPPQRPIVPSVIPPPRIPPPIRPIPPKIPVLGFKRGGDFGEKGRVFQAFTRVKGKLKFLGTPTSSSKLAFGVGSRFVDTTPARTFGVAEISEGRAFKGIDLSGKDKYKKKRGALGIVFIEPSKTAINTAGEFSGITLKSKGRRKNGIF